MDYQKMYTTLFNAITDALSQIETQNYGDAKETLISAQQKAEEIPHAVCRQSTVTRASR